MNGATHPLAVVQILEMAANPEEAIICQNRRAELKPKLETDITRRVDAVFRQEQKSLSSSAS